MMIVLIMAVMVRFLITQFATDGAAILNGYNGVLMGVTKVTLNGDTVIGGKSNSHTTSFHWGCTAAHQF